MLYLQRLLKQLNICGARDLPQLVEQRGYTIYVTDVLAHFLRSCHSYKKAGFTSFEQYCNTLLASCEAAAAPAVGVPSRLERY
ncbi:hypothetical protein EYF80_027291 [Liparis tanakae]|uniref:Uncharacterized protein n=1 Tax=Liparis tanakae TaxID=230148 RepID=A0A4Z2H9D7_9TELE|nr:hypothetical protein EYF80_027291 [Liparis tanakae]